MINTITIITITHLDGPEDVIGHELIPQVLDVHLENHRPSPTKRELCGLSFIPWGEAGSASDIMIMMITSTQ
jgi:hypothetical protein